MSEAVRRLLTTLARAGVELDPETARDALWLALQRSTPAGRATGAADEDAVGAEPSGAGVPLTGGAKPDGDPAEETSVARLAEESPGGGESGRPSRAALSGNVWRRIALPEAVALPGARQLARSLRPLRKDVSAPHGLVFDEETTVARIAEEEVWLPAFRPATERWLDVALVVDASISMWFWRRAARELERTLRYCGAFRAVSSWWLDVDRGAARLYVRDRDLIAARRRRRLNEVTGPGTRRLVLLLSDCVSPAWCDGSMLEVLLAWSRATPVALLQVLPERLWDRTALGDAIPIELRSASPARPNRTLRWRPRDPWLDPAWEFEGARRSRQLLLPIASLEPESLNRLARLIAGANSGWTSGFFLDLEDQVTVGGGEGRVAATPTAVERVERFGSVASRSAGQLAALLAAAPSLTPKLISLVRRELLPEAGPAHEAEVILGGLLRLRAPAGVDPRRHAEVTLEFYDGVRPLLLASGQAQATLEVLKLASREVEGSASLAETFEAWLEEPDTAATDTDPSTILTQEARAFLAEAGPVLDALGGPYAASAERGGAPTRPGALGDQPETDPERETGDEASTPNLVLRPHDLKATAEISGRVEEWSKLEDWWSDDSARIAAIVGPRGDDRVSLAAAFARSRAVAESESSVRNSHVFAWSFERERSWDVFESAMSRFHDALEPDGRTMHLLDSIERQAGESIGSSGAERSRLQGYLDSPPTRALLTTTVEAWGSLSGSRSNVTLVELRSADDGDLEGTGAASRERDAKAWREVGHLEEEGDLRAAIARLERLAERFESEDRPLDHAAVASRLGNLHARLGEAQSALAWFRVAVSLAEGVAEPELLVGTRSDLAEALRQFGQLEEAVAILRRAVAEVPSDRSHDLGLQLSGALAGALAEAGRADEAEAIHQRRLAILETADQPMRLADAVGEYARALSMSGRLDEALEHQARRLSLCEEAGDRKATFHALADYGATLGARGDHDAAIEQLQRRLSLAREITERRELVWALGDLGRAQEVASDLEGARESFDEQVQLLRSDGAEAPAIDLATALGNLSHVHAETGAIDVALALGEERISVAEQLDPVNRAFARAAQSHLLELGGDLEAALALEAEALALHQEAADERGAMHSATRLGRLSDRLGRPEEARSYLAQRLSLAGRVGDDRDHAFALLDYARHLAEQGDQQAALSYLEEARNLAEKLEPLDRATVIAEQAHWSEQTGDLEWAEQLWGEKIALLSGAGAMADSLAARGDLARFLARQERLGEALVVARERLELATPVEWREGHQDEEWRESAYTEALGDYGRLLEQEGSHGKALEAFEEVWRRLPPRILPSGRALAASDLARARRAVDGDPKAAREPLEELWPQVVGASALDPGALAMVGEVLAELRAETGDRAGAREVLDLTLAAYETLGDAAGAERVRTALERFAPPS